MFSVLIPSYNHREYVTDCVISAVRSPLVSEVLLVDDGSSDRSVELFDMLRRLSPRVRILPSPPGENLGAHARLNQLVQAAVNEWVAPLNSDDKLVPGRFEAVRQVVARGAADLLFGDLVLTDDRDNRIGLRKALRHNEVPWPTSWDLPAMLREHHWLPLLLLQNIAATTTNLVFTRTLHAELGGFRPLRYCHDWDFVLRAALRARIEYVPAMLAYYRLHNGNTIKEGSDQVNREVRRMLAGVFIDYPALAGDDDLMRTLHANHHVSPTAPIPLAIVIKDPLVRELLQAKVSAARLPVLMSGSVNDLPSEIRYLYQPTPVGAAALQVNDVRQLLLALAVRGYDALLISRHAGEGASEAEIDDALILRRGAIGRWRSGSVRPLRLYPLDGARFSGTSIAVPDLACQAPPVRVPIAAPLIDRDSRPVIFVLPTFLAVGGVERVVLETMRQLQDRWRFVVITTEPLRPEQGSVHAEAMQFAPVYDLAELTTPEDRLRAFEVLRDWHAPALIWIVNGAPWQADHAMDIRALFHDTPIIDNQAYDHQEGWINRYHEQGIRAADRFIAINRKIQRAMQERFGIRASQIDLVYPGADISRVARRAVSSELVAQHRRRFKLDPGRQVFGMVGRLTQQKRPLDLVALAKRIGRSAQFVWIGSGDLQTDMQAAVRSVPNAKLIAAQSDVRSMYEMLDGLVITSEYEGLPLVLIEALATGVPVLSTDVGAIREVLDRYGSGMTYQPAGDLAELEGNFRQFRKLLPELRRVALRQASRVAEDFSSNRMALEYEASFSKAIAEFDRQPEGEHANKLNISVRQARPLRRRPTVQRRVAADSSASISQVRTGL